MTDNKQEPKFDLTVQNIYLQMCKIHCTSWILISTSLKAIHVNGNVYLQKWKSICRNLDCTKIDIFNNSEVFVIHKKLKILSGESRRLLILESLDVEDQEASSLDFFIDLTENGRE